MQLISRSDLVLDADHSLDCFGEPISFYRRASRFVVFQTNLKWRIPVFALFAKNVANPPACYRSLSGPSGPKCPGPKCPRECPRKRGVSEGVSDGCLRTLRARAPECPKSVPRVSPEWPRSVRDTLFDTPGTLSGHFLDTLPRAPPVFGDAVPPRELDFGLFRVRLGPFRVRLGPVRSVSGPFRVLLGVLGGVGVGSEWGFCKGKRI